MKSKKFAGILVASLTLASSTFAQRAVEAVKPEAIKAAEKALELRVPEAQRSALSKAFQENISKIGGAVTAAMVLSAAGDAYAKTSTAEGAKVALESIERTQEVVSKAIEGQVTTAENAAEARVLLGSVSSPEKSCAIRRNFTASALNPEKIEAAKAFDSVQTSSDTVDAAYAGLGIAKKVDRGSLLSWAAEGSDVAKGGDVMLQTLSKASEEALAKGLKGDEALSFIRAQGLALVADSMKDSPTKDLDVKEFDKECMNTFMS